MCDHPDVGYYLPRGYRISIAKLCRHHAEPELTGFEKAYAKYSEYAEIVLPAGTSGYLALQALYSAGKAEVIAAVEAWESSGLGFSQRFREFLDKLKGGAK